MGRCSWTNDANWHVRHRFSVVFALCPDQLADGFGHVGACGKFVCPRGTCRHYGSGDSPFLPAGLCGTGRASGRLCSHRPPCVQQTASGLGFVRGVSHAGLLNRPDRFCGVRVRRQNLGRQEAATHRSQSGADRTWRGQYCSGSVGRIPGHGRILAFGGEFRCRCGHANGFHFHCSRYCACSPAVNACPLLSSQGGFGGDNHRRSPRVDRLEYPEAVRPLLPRRSLRGVTHHTGYAASRRRTWCTHRRRGIDRIASLSNEYAALCSRWEDARLRALSQRKTS